MRLDLNLIEKPRSRFKTLLPWLATISLAALLSALVFYPNYTLYHKMSARKEAYLTQIKQIESANKKLLLRANQKKTSTGQLAAAAEKINFLNRLWRQKHFYWTEFLNHLERNVPQDISLTRIAPAADTQTVIIEGVAKSTDNIVAFMKNLQRDASFKEVFLMSQMKSNYLLQDKKTRRQVEKFRLNFQYQKDES